MSNPILKYFSWSHLPPHLQLVSEPIQTVALQIDANLPDSAEKSAGLRKLLEAKDCFVRAALEQGGVSTNAVHHPTEPPNPPNPVPDPK